MYNLTPLPPRYCPPPTPLLPPPPPPHPTHTHTHTAPRTSGYPLTRPHTSPSTIPGTNTPQQLAVQFLLAPDSVPLSGLRWRATRGPCERVPQGRMGTMVQQEYPILEKQIAQLSGRVHDMGSGATSLPKRYWCFHPNQTLLYVHRECADVGCYKGHVPPHHSGIAQRLCECRGGLPGLPVPDKPYGFCGRKATVNHHSSIVQELCESRGGRPGLSVLTSLMVSVAVKQY